MLALSTFLRDLLTGRPSNGDRDVDVDFDRLDEPKPSEPEARPREGHWHESSFDLQRGLEVSEEPLESMPAELAAEFLKR